MIIPMMIIIIIIIPMPSDVSPVFRHDQLQGGLMFL